MSRHSLSKRVNLCRNISKLCLDIKQADGRETLSRHRNFMSRHNQEQEKGSFVATKLLCRNIRFEHSSCKALKKCNDTRHFFRDNYKTNSAELCRDIFKLCRDMIPGKGIEECRDITLQATTKNWRTNKIMS